MSDSELDKIINSTREKSIKRKRNNKKNLYFIIGLGTLALILVVTKNLFFLILIVLLILILVIKESIEWIG